jgi:hypothetical protein
MRLIKIVFVIYLVLISFVPAQAASSTTVWIENELNADMEFWAAEGLIESQLSSTKPIARSELGRQIVAALNKCDFLATPSDTCKNIRIIFQAVFCRNCRGQES